jgi:hypothetical protein
LRDVYLTATLRLPANLAPVAGPAAVFAGVVAGSFALAVGSATTRLVPLARATLAAARRTRNLPLPLPLVGEPLLLGEEKLATDGDRL